MKQGISVYSNTWSGEPIYEFVEPGEHTTAILWRDEGDVYRCLGLVYNRDNVVFYANLEDEIG